MEENPSLNFLKNKGFYAFLVGVVIASMHFAITSIMSPLAEVFPPRQFSFWSVRDFIEMALIAPSIAPLAIVSLPASDIFVYLLSSFLYGITGGLLALNRKKLRWLGIILAGWLILSSCFIWFMLAAML